MRLDLVLAISAGLPLFVVSLATFLGKFKRRRLIVTLLSSSALSAVSLVALKCLGPPAQNHPNGLFLIDRLSALMLALISCISLITVSYSHTFLEGDTYRKRFIALLTLVALVLAVMVVSGNILMLFACWCCLTPLLSALANHLGTSAAKAASSKLMRYHLVSDALFGTAVILLLTHGGSTNIETYPRLSPEQKFSAPISDVIAVLIASAALIKSSIFPFHNWLLGTLEAPTTFSAFLHAGLINSAGFIGFRLAPLIFSSSLAASLFVVLGLVSSIFGAVCSLAQPDVKRKLVFSTIAQMGFMCLQCGLGAFSAALFHLILHGCFKCYLFLDAGSVITASKSRQFPVSSEGAIYPALVITPFLSLLFFARHSAPTVLVPVLIFSLCLVYECLRVRSSFRISPLDLGVRFVSPMLAFVILYAIASSIFSSLFAELSESPMTAPILLSFAGLMLVAWSAVNSKALGSRVKDWLYVFALNGGYLTND